MESLEDGDSTPYAGVIRLGWKDVDEKGRQQLHAADHFILPEHLVPVLGEGPKELDVIFVSNDLDQVLTSSYRRYGLKQGLICYGANGTAWPLALAAQEYGLKATEQGYVDGNGEVRPVRGRAKPRIGIECPEDGCVFVAARMCRPVMALRFALVKRPLTEIYAIFSTSRKNFINVLKTLALAQDFLAAAGKTDREGRGDITGIPMKLRIRTRDAHPQIEGKDGPSVISTRVPELWLDSGLDQETLRRIAERPKAWLNLSVAIPQPTPEEEPKPEDLFLDEPEVQVEASVEAAPEAAEARVEEQREEAKSAPEAPEAQDERPAQASKAGEGEKPGEPFEATVDLVAAFERRSVKGVRRLVAAARSPEGESLTLLGKAGSKELERVLEGLPAEAVVRIKGRRAKQFVEVEEAELVGEPADEWGGSLEEFFA